MIDLDYIKLAAGSAFTGQVFADELVPRHRTQLGLPNYVPETCDISVTIFGQYKVVYDTIGEPVVNLIYVQALKGAKSVELAASSINTIRIANLIAAETLNARNQSQWTKV